MCFGGLGGLPPNCLTYSCLRLNQPPCTSNRTICVSCQGSRTWSRIRRMTRLTDDTWAMQVCSDEGPYVATAGSWDSITPTHQWRWRIYGSGDSPLFEFFSPLNTSLAVECLLILLNSFHREPQQLHSKHHSCVLMFGQNTPEAMSSTCPSKASGRGDVHTESAQRAASHACEGRM